MCDTSTKQCASCFDQERNGDETDVDCGGKSSRCEHVRMVEMRSQRRLCVEHVFEVLVPRASTVFKTETRLMWTVQDHARNHVLYLQSVRITQTVSANSVKRHLCLSFERDRM